MTFHPEMGEIIMLHRVVRKKSLLEANRELEITPEFLEKTILDFKLKGYELVSLDYVNEVVTKQKRPKNKFICLTFDDGYIDNYELAYPILKKHHCPFTIFVTTNFPEGKALIWWYLLENILINNDKITLGDGSQYDCSTLAKKNATFVAIRLKIFDLQSNSVETIFWHLFANYEISIRKQMESLSLSWEQIKNLSNDPLCTIGSHAISHSALDKVNENQLDIELLNSKKLLEKYIQKSVYHFAYPYGRNNDEMIYKLKQLGYKTAVIANGGKIRKESNPFRLEREILMER